MSSVFKTTLPEVGSIDPNSLMSIHHQQLAQNDWSDSCFVFKSDKLKLCVKWYYKLRIKFLLKLRFCIKLLAWCSCTVFQRNNPQTHMPLMCYAILIYLDPGLAVFSVSPVPLSQSAQSYPWWRGRCGASGCLHFAGDWAAHWSDSCPGTGWPSRPGGCPPPGNTLACLQYRATGRRDVNKTAVLSCWLSEPLHKWKCQNENGLWS